MEVKGTAVIAIRDYVKSNFSNEYLKWIDSMSSSSKTIYESAIDSTEWYAVESGVQEPTDKIGKLFFKGDLEQGAKESGRYGAEKALTGIYKIFVKAANPGYLIKRASRVFATYYRPCEMKVIRQMEKGVVARISLISDKDIIINRIIGWCEVGLQISGCQNVKVTPQYNFDDKNEKVVDLEMTWD